LEKVEISHFPLIREVQSRNDRRKQLRLLEAAPHSVGKTVVSVETPALPFLG
jgi:hypothetical protein